MKVFISWSGESSKRVAKALRDWIPKVIQAVQPWLSVEDIPKGDRWNQYIDRWLKGTKFGLICLTPENLTQPWILFEAGALVNSVGQSRVRPYLFRVQPSGIELPLAQFQLTRAEKNDTQKLLRTINSAVAASGGRALTEKEFAAAFEKWWPEFEQRLEAIPHSPKQRRAPIRRRYPWLYGPTPFVAQHNFRITRH